MRSILIQLLPLIIGSMAMPTWILLVLFMLRSRHGLVGAVAFVGGVTAVRLLQGIIFGAILSAYEISHRRDAPGTVVSTLLLVTGILMWTVALKQMWRQNDPDRPLPSWMTMISAITPIRALGLGMLLVVTSSRCWLFTLAALGVISRAELGPAPSVVAFLLYVLGAQLLLVAPILVSVRSSARFDAGANWLETHNRPIVIAVSLVVGSFFLWSGAIGLIG
ncbi:MAG: GAP family protein [Ktedonobacterales bacterium]